MEMNQNQIMELLDALYEKSINGIPKLSQPIDVLANDYLSKIIQQKKQQDNL